MNSECPSQFVLVVYFMAEAEFLARPGFLTSIYSFTNANSAAEIEYLNLAASSSIWLLKKHYGTIIFHYSIFAERMNSDESFSKRMELCEPLSEIEGHKIAIVQDEYVRMSLLCSALIKLGVETLCTCVPKAEFRKAYPIELLGEIEPIFVIAGYPDKSMTSRSSWPSHRARVIDISYRARRLPVWLGDTATLKYLVAERVKSFVSEYHSGLTVDISTNPRDSLSGKSWRTMLVNSRAVLGSESGVSLLDFNGSIHDYAKTHSEVQTQEFARAHGQKFELRGISPRHFEAASTKTCQLLVEGYYSGILSSRRHYLPIKADFSNLQDVLREVEDLDKCESIAEVAHREIIQNERYSEKYFVNMLLDRRSTSEQLKIERGVVRRPLLNLQNLLAPFKHIVINMKLLAVRVINQAKAMSHS